MIAKLYLLPCTVSDREPVMSAATIINSSNADMSMGCSGARGVHRGPFISANA